LPKTLLFGGSIFEKKSQINGKFGRHRGARNIGKRSPIDNGELSHLFRTILKTIKSGFFSLRYPSSARTANMKFLAKKGREINCPRSSSKEAEILIPYF
jgi:hypothetical protein